MPWYAFDLGKPDVEVFLPWEGGYEDAKMWALDHGLAFSDQVSGTIKPTDNYGATIELIFCRWFSSQAAAEEAFMEAYERLHPEHANL